MMKVRDFGIFMSVKSFRRMYSIPSRKIRRRARKRSGKRHNLTPILSRKKMNSRTSGHMPFLKQFRIDLWNTELTNDMVAFERFTK